MDKFVLIDGNSLINRAFYATPPLSAPDGRPTNAVYAFINMLIRIINEDKPHYLLVAFDRREPTFRHKIFDGYKGTRKPMPEDLACQLPLLKSVLKAMGIAIYEKAGFEADDILGTLAKTRGHETLIISGDKDIFQLVDEKISVHFTKRGISDTEEYNFVNFKEKTGILPYQIIEYKALSGDSSDNIPGVSGVGEKTALSLLKEYGDLDNIYAHLEEIKGKLKEKLALNEKNARLSKTLATINTAVEIPLKNADFEYSYPFNGETHKLFVELGFKNLLKRNDIFSQDSVKASQKKEVKTVLVKEKSQIQSFINSPKISLFLGDFISFYDFNNIEYRLAEKEGFFDGGFTTLEAYEIVGKIFSDEKKKVIVYYKNALRHSLEKYGIEFKADFEDVSIMKYLVDYTGKDEKLFDVFLSYDLNKETPAFSLAELYLELEKKLVGDEKRLYLELELPLADVLYEMEKEGVKADLSALEDMKVDYKARIDSLLEKIQMLAGEKINPNSTQQLGKLLFEKLGLKHGKKTKSGFSTDAAVLEELTEEHPIIPLIMKYRQLTKLYSTYIEGFKPLIDAKTGLIHTTFNQVMTSTGRLSSREPNLQNIPVRDDEGREIRRLFAAKGNDRILIDADYSQIELRLLAAFSGCKPLIDAFIEGKDIHAQTAATVFDVPIEEVTSSMRRSAKAVNFGIVYGISDFGLAKNLKISPKKAGEYIKKYFELYPEVKDYMNKNVEFAKKNGYAVTIFKRKRYINELKSPNFNLRSFGERAAMNMPLQGSSADIIKLAMLNVYKRLQKEGCKSRLILQVHDELIIDAFKDEADIVAKLLKEEMENAVKLAVPLTVEVAVCENWFDAK